ncbi:MAG TPA: hypothetical protein P5266_03025 [Candidatus Fermentibacter sp.]|nr:hypothetical protein [Candidatus Fermentibacter sp.]
MKRVLLAVLLSLSVASAQTVLGTIDAPDTNISGLAYGGGSLWAVDGVTNYLHSVDPATGSVLGSWYVTPVAGETPTGCAFGNGTVYVGMTNDYVNMYNTSGEYQGQFTVAC